MEEEKDFSPKEAFEKLKKGDIKKSTIVGLVFLGIFFVVTVLGFVFQHDLRDESGWFNTYDTGISFFNSLLRLVPKLVTSIMILFLTLLVLYIVCFVIKKVFRGNPRRITIGKLVNSIFKVVVWVVCIIAILAAWGVNVAALVAGAGVLTLIIGLGMQSLIADVVAGVFLVCDGTLQVGDIVQIDGWRGEVQEIGIRNTKLINATGDIRVANNSTIKVFVNQSRVNSFPTVTVGVEYGEDLKKVESIFEQSKEEIRAHLPLALDEPTYLGVDALDASSVNLLFGIHCKEGDFFAVQRGLKREIKLLFDANGINIPFPQVVVNEREKQGE